MVFLEYEKEQKIILFGKPHISLGTSTPFWGLESGKWIAMLMRETAQISLPGRRSVWVGRQQGEGGEDRRFSEGKLGKEITFEM